MTAGVETTDDADVMVELPAPSVAVARTLVATVPLGQVVTAAAQYEEP